MIHHIQLEIVPECEVGLTFEVQSMKFSMLGNNGDMIISIREKNFIKFSTNL